MGFYLQMLRNRRVSSEATEWVEDAIDPGPGVDCAGRSTVALSVIRWPKLPGVLRADDRLRMQHALSVIVAFRGNRIFHDDRHALKRGLGRLGIDRDVVPIALPED